MNNEYNVWCKWHPLRTVILGDCYRPQFFQGIKNARIRSALTRITEETMEDLVVYEKVLRDFGCTVIRPQIDDNDSIYNYIGQDGKAHGSVPRQPLQPRDSQLVIGHKLYFTGRDVYPVMSTILNYNRSHTDALSMNNHLMAPLITVVGRDIYIDSRLDQRDSMESICAKLERFCPAMRLNKLMIGSHNDGCFHTLKPGAILSLYDIQDYQHTFPGWDVCYLPNQSWDKVDGFFKLKEKVRGKWWVPGEEDNDEFTNFVETWLQDWVGYCEESVFDVNVLMLDDKHVCVNNYNETAFAFFKKHGIEPIIVPWRHRYFWDGGLHCITLDLYRDGEMEDYFPNRLQPIVDLGYD